MSDETKKGPIASGGDPVIAYRDTEKMVSHRFTIRVRRPDGTERDLRAYNERELEQVRKTEGDAIISVTDHWKE